LSGDVLASLDIVHNKVLAPLHHRGEVFERHMSAGARVVEPPIGVFFDYDRMFRFSHGELDSYYSQVT
jgi:hypothetical protein